MLGADDASRPGDVTGVVPDYKVRSQNLRYDENRSSSHLRTANKSTTRFRQGWQGLSNVSLLESKSSERKPKKIRRRKIGNKWPSGHMSGPLRPHADSLPSDDSPRRWCCRRTTSRKVD